MRSNVPVLFVPNCRGSDSFPRTLAIMARPYQYDGLYVTVFVSVTYWNIERRWTVSYKLFLKLKYSLILETNYTVSQ